MAVVIPPAATVNSIPVVTPALMSALLSRRKASRAVVPAESGRRSSSTRCVFVSVVASSCISQIIALSPATVVAGRSHVHVCPYSWFTPMATAPTPVASPRSLMAVVPAPLSSSSQIRLPLPSTVSFPPPPRTEQAMYVGRSHVPSPTLTRQRSLPVVSS